MSEPEKCPNCGTRIEFRSVRLSDSSGYEQVAFVARTDECHDVISCLRLQLAQSLVRAKKVGAENVLLRQQLRLIQSIAGNPDAAEACRLITAETTEALTASEEADDA